MPAKVSCCADVVGQCHGHLITLNQLALRANRNGEHDAADRLRQAVSPLQQLVDSARECGLSSERPYLASLSPIAQVRLADRNMTVDTAAEIATDLADRGIGEAEILMAESIPVLLDALQDKTVLQVEYRSGPAPCGSVIASYESDELVIATPRVTVQTTGCLPWAICGNVADNEGELHAVRYTLKAVTPTPTACIGEYAVDLE